MRKPAIGIVAGVLGFLGLMLSGCGIDLRYQSSSNASQERTNRYAGDRIASRPVRYASLEAGRETAIDSVTNPALARSINKAFQAITSSQTESPLRITVTKARPVRSLLEMRHHDVIIQSWDLSCGAAALATLLRYEWGDPVTEKKVAQGLMARKEYIQHPNLVQVREGFSLLDLKHYVEAHGFKGEGFGQLDFDDLVEKAPIMVPVDALGYNHFVIFRGVMNDRVLLADPAWGNRTMTIDKFKRMWLDYGKRMGHVGFVVVRPGVAPLSRMQPQPSEFVMFD